MNKTYKHWFSLLFNHDYFPNQECTVFNLIPVQDSLKTIKNYRIRFQKDKNEFKCFIEVPETKEIWEELDNAEDLFFYVENTDPYFYNYSDIEHLKDEHVTHYFTNDDITNRFNEKISISPTTKITIQPLSFNLKVDKLQSNTIAVKYKSQNIVNYTSQKGESTIPINLSAFGSGQYELWINNILQNKFYATSTMPSLHSLGILHINMRNIRESLKENTLPKMNINFSARAAFREYVVVIPEYKKIEIKNISIDSGGNETYSPPEKKVVFQEHGESYVFVSEQPLKFYQKTKAHPLLKIQYMNQFSDVLIEHDLKIPVPNANSIKIKSKNDEDTYYSQSIIYV
ncbi:hypothetical protein [Tenacibaculum agarivorans]|uniref:hypothetical protein n=1 Tax=Tenacibaculum agarivorans TaxID=1908389 RepID=UPI00094BA4AB|nr:hypothetical protein [Tenacibaculum agarivorans]